MHKLCQASAERILSDFKPNLIIAIGGGGYVPARILRYVNLQGIAGSVKSDLVCRSFLKKPGNPNIPIQAIGLSLYESLGADTPEEIPGTKVTRTQWLDLSSLEMANLIGKNVLIVDEVDDTRTTLEYAVRELEKDVQTATENLGRTAEKTKFSIFVLHNKDKPKKGKLPEDMIKEGRYIAAVTTGDEWVCYPWESEVRLCRRCRIDMALQGSFSWPFLLTFGSYRTLTSTTATPLHSAVNRLGCLWFVLTSGARPRKSEGWRLVC